MKKRYAACSTAVARTAVEQKLIYRINLEDALLAAEEIFRILIKALRHRERTGGRRGLAAVRKGKRTMSHDAEVDMKLERALATFDRAMIALHLSHSAQTQEERVEEAQRAHIGFEAALTALEKADPAFKLRDEWSAWYDEVQKGLVATRERLLSLGVKLSLG